MTEVTNNFASALPKLLAQVNEDISQLLDVPIEFDCGNVDFKPVEQLLDEMKPGVVVCRSKYIKNACGVGGLLLCESAADDISRAAMMMDAREDGEPFEFVGLVDEAMEEVWNVFLGVWNRIADPDFRMSTDVEERATEYYSSSLPFPPASGLFPEGLMLPLSVNSREYECAFFPPIKVIRKSEQRAFSAQEHFVKHSTDGPNGSTESADATEADSSSAAVPSGRTKPVVFLDYSGLVLPWLRLKAADERLQYLMSDKFDEEALKGGADGPVAAVLAGLDLDVLTKLSETCSVVEIRKRG